MDPTKRVRFADIPPRTPSPTSSSTSWGSSPGPSTPPQLSPLRLPPTIARPIEYPPWPHRIPTAVYTPQRLSAPVPALMVMAPEGDLVIDPLLLAPRAAAHPPPLLWDLLEHPNSIVLGSVGEPRARELSHQDLASCAVRTSAKGSPLLLRRVVLVFPGLPLQVDIVPIDSPVWSATPLPYLTVGDVLYNLYRALRLSIEPAEFDSLDRAHQESVSRAFKKRLRRDPDNLSKNVHHGVRRIDYLGEMRWFRGLRPAVGSELPPGRRRGEVLVVNLAPAP